MCTNALPYQNAVLQVARRTPVKHARRVVLHFGLLEVKVLGLIVGNAGRHCDAVARLGAGAAATTCRPERNIGVVSEWRVG